MYNQKALAQSIAAFIENIKHKLSDIELNELLEIQKQILDSKREEQLLAWGFELLKYITLYNQFFDK